MVVLPRHFWASYGEMALYMANSGCFTPLSGVVTRLTTGAPASSQPLSTRDTCRFASDGLKEDLSCQT